MTIVILIILATISINILFGNEGILQRAKWAGYVTEYESVAEAIELYQVNQELNKYGVESAYKIASTSTSIAKNSEESIYPINIQERVENSNISQTLRRTIVNYEGLKSGDISDTEKVNLYKVDFSKIKVNVKKEYVINIVNGNLYSLQYEEYNKNIYHTPRMGIKETTKIIESGTYEIVVDAGDIVSWDSVQLYYQEFVEGSLECKVFTSDDEIEWKEANIKLGSSEKLEEQYNIIEADSTQYLKVQLEIEDVNGKNTKVDYVMVNFYKYRDTEIIPEITVEVDGEEIDSEGESIKQGDVYSISTPSNGQVEAAGTATVTQKIEVPTGEGEYLLRFDEIYGTPNTIVTITKADGTKEEIDMTETNKITVPAGATVEVKTELQAGDGVGKVEILKKDSKVSQETRDEYDRSWGTESEGTTGGGTSGSGTTGGSTSGGTSGSGTTGGNTSGGTTSNKSWITVKQNKYAYNNGGTGYWEKCLVNETEVDETGIIIESEQAVKRIKITYQTSSDGKSWGSIFTNIQDARNTQYLKVIVEYQVIQGNEYGDTSNNKIKVILNDGSWKATFVDENGTELFNQYAYFTSSEMTGNITLPNCNSKEGKTFIGWKIGDNSYKIGETYTLTKNEKFTAIYQNTDIYTKEDMIAFRDNVNKGYSFEGITVRLMKDIDLEGSSANQWIPIGNYGKNTALTFKGTFDGNNHKISGLYIQNDNSYQGLFGLNQGEIKNVIIEQGQIKSSGVGETLAGSAHIGAIAGWNSAGIIENCINKIKVEGNAAYKEDLYVAGIVGVNEQKNGIPGIIKDCTNEGEIIAEGSHDTIGTAGIVGFNNAEVKNCINTAKITNTNTNTTESNLIAGIVGYSHWDSTLEESIVIVKNCTNSGEILSAGNGQWLYTGGITGFNRGKVDTCINTGKITNPNTSGTDNNLVGGITSYNTNLIQNCINKGVVINSGSAPYVYAGGISGHHVSERTTAQIINCSNEKAITNNGTASNSLYVGGISGTNQGDKMLNVFNSAPVECNGTSQYLGVGGIAGLNTSKLFNSYNNGAIKVTGKGNTWTAAGGITGAGESGAMDLGYNTGTITNTGTGTRYTGSVAGYSHITVTNCYYLSGTASAGIGYNKVSGATVQNETYMKSEAFVTLLNSLRKTGYLQWTKTTTYPELQSN